MIPGLYLPQNMRLRGGGPLAISAVGYTTLDTGGTSWASADFGAEAPDRILVVVLRGQGVEGGAIASGTIGGVAATITNFSELCVMAASVPSGTSGTVAWSWSSASSSNRVQIYAFNITGGAQGLTPISGSGARVTGRASIDVSIDTVANGALFGFASASGSLVLSATNITVLQQKYDGLAYTIASLGNLTPSATSGLTVSSSGGGSAARYIGVVTWE